MQIIRLFYFKTSGLYTSLGGLENQNIVYIKLSLYHKIYHYNESNFSPKLLRYFNFISSSVLGLVTHL